MRAKHILGIGVALALIIGAAAIPRAQQTRPSATLDDLLAEVQGLRADLARSSSATIRVQVLTARLSLEEQRINDEGRELAAAQLRLNDISARLQAAQASVKELETAVGAHSMPVEREHDVENILPARRAEIVRLQASEQALRSDVTSLTNVVADEQDRWSDFSSRLDELERALPAGR